MMKILHNPRCRKSRETLAILQEENFDPEIQLYLENPPSEKELLEILDMLGISAFELIRKGEAIYKEKFKGKVLGDEEWVEIMLEYPKLIERPIVIHDGKAVIGRPPQNVLDII